MNSTQIADDMLFLASGGQMGELIRSFDWRRTPLGIPSGWPRSLKTAVGLMLQARQPAYIAWGPQQISLYNDGYIPILGAKHPAGLGRPASELWAEIWDVLGPLNEAVLGGEAQFFQDRPFALGGRNRPVSWFSFSYTPLRNDDDRIAGIFCAAIETTDRILAEQRAGEERERLTRMFNQAPGFVALLDGPEHRFGMVNPAYMRLIGHREVLGKTVAEALPDAVEQGYLEVLDSVYASGEAITFKGASFTSKTPGPVYGQQHFLDFVYQPVTDGSGEVTGIFVQGFDVTERVLAEVALRESHSQYRMLFNAIDEGFCIIEQTTREGRSDFRYVAVDPAFEAATGTSGVLGKTVTEAFPEEGGDWIEIYQKVLATDQAIRFEHSLPSKRRFLELFASPLKGGSSRLVAVVFNDVTARRRAEAGRQALVQLGDCIRDLVDPEELSFAAAAILGRTLGVSRAGYGAVNMRAETITIERDWNMPGVQSIAGTLHFRDYGTYIDDLKRGQTAVVTDAESDSRTRATASRLKAISAQSFVNMPVTEQGGFVALLFLNHAEPREWTAEDLTLIREVAERTRTAVARLEAEREVRALAASLESQVEERTAERDRVWRNSRDLLVIVGADGIFRAVNPAWTTILGHPADEVVGRSFLEFIWPEDAGLTQGGLDRAVAAQDLTNFENRYRHKDGTPRWISWHTSVEGGLVYAYGRDITAENEAAAELAQAQETLRQAQKLEAVGQLTGGVAHDFNNLLTIIKSSTELLRRPDLPEDRRRRYIEAISETVDRAARLTGQLLAFARRQSLKPEVFDAGERLRAVADMLKSIVGSRIRIALDVPREPCFVEADVSQFETALVNMVVNARDAMEGEGALSLRVREFAAAPALRGHRIGQGPYVAISVADNGSGIAPDVLARIFEPFFTTKDIGKGTGLGLSQVYGFAKQSGGDVSVDSAVGSGSTFTMFLPRSEVQGITKEKQAGTAAVQEGRGCRVLVVEDNLDVGTSSTQLLQDLGYDTTWATSAAEALALLSRASFDVVFSDVVMPGMSGIEFGSRVRQDYPGLPVVLTSGYSDILAENGRHGFDLLQKPYAVEDLSRVLQQVARREPRRDSEP